MEQNKRVAGSALAALSALTLGVGMMATPPVAQAQSSSSSIVDEAGSSVNLGSEMGEVPERDAPVYRSGLPDVEPQGEHRSSVPAGGREAGGRLAGAGMGARHCGSER